MLSVLLACAFISRQFWGMLADRIGGLRAVMAGSACQAVAIGAFLLTQNEIGLFAVSAAFGLGFSGIIPSYVVAIRELFPSSEASWRVPTFFFLGMSGMAFGSWLAGALYDHFGFYAPAFAVGVFFNIANLVVIGFLVRDRAAARFRLAYSLSRRLRPGSETVRGIPRRLSCSSSGRHPRWQIRLPAAESAARYLDGKAFVLLANHSIGRVVIASSPATSNRICVQRRGRSARDHPSACRMRVAEVRVPRALTADAI